MFKTCDFRRCLLWQVSVPVVSGLQLCMCLCVLLRHLSFSSPRLLDHDHDESVSTRADLSSYRPYSFYSASSDRLNRWQPGVTGNVPASSVDTDSDIDTRWCQSSSDGSTRRNAGDFSFYFDRPTPRSRLVRATARQPHPLSSRHSNLHNSPNFVMPSSSNFDHAYTD